MRSNFEPTMEPRNNEHPGASPSSSRKFKISTVLALAAILVIVAGSAYGLANGTIFQHRDEGTSLEACDGECGDCDETGTDFTAQGGQAGSPSAHAVESTATCPDCEDSEGGANSQTAPAPGAQNGGTN